MKHGNEAGSTTREQPSTRCKLSCVHSISHAKRPSCKTCGAIQVRLPCLSETHMLRPCLGGLALTRLHRACLIGSGAAGLLTQNDLKTSTQTEIGIAHSVASYVLSTCGENMSRPGQDVGDCYTFSPFTSSPWHKLACICHTLRFTAPPRTQAQCCAAPLKLKAAL